MDPYPAAKAIELSMQNRYCESFLADGMYVVDETIGGRAKRESEKVRCFKTRRNAFKSRQKSRLQLKVVDLTDNKI